MTFEGYKESGDSYYRNKQYQLAIEAYTKAIQSVNNENSYLCYSNRSAAFLHQGNYIKALQDAESCIDLKRNWIKGYLRKGDGLERMGRKQDALSNYETALLNCSPNNNNSTAAIQEIRDKIYRLREELRTTSSSFNVQNIFSQIQTGFSSIISKLQSIIPSIQIALQSAYYNSYDCWLSLNDDTKRYIQLGVIGLGIYLVFFGSNIWGGYSDYPGYSYNSYYSSGNGLSWTMWAAVMYGAYKIPPMLPDLLGPQFARPFFGMNWTTFMWLVSMLSNNQRRSYGPGMGGGGYGMGGYGLGNIFRGHRRYY